MLLNPTNQPTQLIDWEDGIISHWLQGGWFGLVSFI